MVGGIVFYTTPALAAPTGANYLANLLKFSTTTTGCLQGATTASGIVTTYFTGTACGSGTGGSDPFTHPSAGVSATTSGMIITASSTIGSGTQAGGLTINGGATTTGFLVVQGTGTSTFTTDVSLRSNHGVVEAHAFVADESDGLRLENNARGLVALLGAGNGLGTTFYDGVNIDGQTRLATSLTGLLKATAGVVSVATAGIDYLSSYDAWTHPASGVSATTSQVRMNGFISTASSTVDGNLNITGNSTSTNATSTNSFYTQTAKINSADGQLGLYITAQGSNPGNPLYITNQYGTELFVTDKNGVVTFDTLQVPNANGGNNYIGGYIANSNAKTTFQTGTSGRAPIGTLDLYNNATPQISFQKYTIEGGGDRYGISGYYTDWINNTAAARTGKLKLTVNDFNAERAVLNASTTGSDLYVGLAEDRFKFSSNGTSSIPYASTTALTVTGKAYVVGSAVATTPSSVADLIINDNSNASIQLIGGTTATQYILFGDTDNDVGAISYDHTNNLLELTVGTNNIVDFSSASIGLGTSTQASTKVEIGGTQLTSGGDNGTGEFLNISGLLNFSSNSDQGSVIKVQPTVTNSGTSNTFFGVNVDPRTITNTSQISGYASYRAAEETTNTFGTSSIGYLYGNHPGGTTDYGIYLNSADTNYLGSGNVGVGTSSPASTLTVASNVSALTGAYGPAQLFLQGNSGNVGLQMRNDATGGRVFSLVSSSAAASAPSSLRIYDSTAGADRLTINSSGNVGIATSTPQWLLNPFSSTAPQLSLSAGAGLAQWTMRNAGGNLYFATTTVAGDATTSTSALSLFGSGVPSLQIGSTTPQNTLKNGSLVLGGGGDSAGITGSSTIQMAKIQIDGLNSAGARVCVFVQGTTLVASSGACTP